ncbi:hypothetical protein ACPXCG_14295 [Gordonia sp. DT218]|uniref:hypothetical protein n=1 Tax=Gordonia sp. DT218 TaxID=3416659 RepID=UPI003CEE7659
MKYIGVYSYAELIATGLTRKEIRRQCKTGDLIRLGRDRYADKAADQIVCEVVRRGHVVSCLTALRYHGVWVPGTATKVHKRGNSDAYRKANALCRQYGRPGPLRSAVDDVPTALRHAAKCVDGEELVAVCDSILNKELMTIDEIRTEMASAPLAKRRLLDVCDGHAQSGTESMVRCRLRSRRISVRVQVQIEGIGRVDLLVGDRLIIEIDSEEYHRTAEQYEEDRRRDRRAAEDGYLTMRFTYAAVTTGWADAEGQVLAIVREGRHLRRGTKKTDTRITSANP